MNDHFVKGYDAGLHCWLARTKWVAFCGVIFALNSTDAVNPVLESDGGVSFFFEGNVK
ncbi:hypothetical protein FC17_GL001842 [Secundilactobacillus paracollinoides DSM 15502 = JCM 11969]|nr:hypothetical protein FC17_GL001842 [Secundilactobacillus paracollinoides DSM 15502 = JCM 11969]